MMDADTSREGLDELLQTWANSRAADADQLQHLQSRVLDAVLRDVAADAQPQWHATTSSASKSPGGWLLAGMAASLLLATCALRFSEPSLPVAAEGPPAASWLGPEELRERALVAERMTAVYGDRVRWFAETNEQLEIALSEDASLLSTAQPLALRFVVERRKPGTTAWSSLSQLDVVSRGEDVIEIPAAVAGLALRVWAYRLPDGMIFVDSAVDFTGENGLHSAGSRLLESGRPSEVDTSRQHDWEYRIYQAAAELPSPS